MNIYKVNPQCYDVLMSTVAFMRKIYIGLLVVSAGLAAVTIIGHTFGLDLFGLAFIWYQFDLRLEGSIATYIESVMMLSCGLLCFSMATDPTVRTITRWTPALFIVLMLSSVFMAFDEMFTLHEKLGSYLSGITGFAAGTFLEGFSWMLYYAPLALVAGVILYLGYKNILRTMPKTTQKRIIRYLILMFIGIAGVLGLEMLEGYLYDLDIVASIFPSFEESFELVVIIAFFRLNLLIYEERSSKTQ